jgi:hypothetical protein
MSIRVEVKRCVTAGTLFVLQPAVPSSPVRRTLTVSAEMHGLLHGPWTTPEDEIRWNRVRADFDWFIGGNLIAVTEDGGHMKPLNPETDGIWEIPCRNPKPSIRVFGGFTETDVFAALSWRHRKPLREKGSPEWAEAIRECKAEWRKCFLTYPPHVGNNINEYISEHVVRI